MSVQQTIIKGIKEQLFLNDYLVLPGFGGFVLKSSSTHFSSTSFLLVPPSKTVSFNAQLKQNDGVLATFLQTKLNCDSKQALDHLKDFAEFCSTILSTKRRLALDGIGFFYLDFENNLCFEPQADCNFLRTSFGLGAVSIKELEQVPVETKKEPLFIDRNIERIEEPRPIIKTRRNYSGVIIPTLISVLFLALLLMFVSNAKMSGELKSAMYGDYSKNSYSPLLYSELQILNSSKLLNAYVADANGIATLELENSKKIGVKALENTLAFSVKNSSKRASKSSYTSSGKFEIVLGCFSVLENANKMISKLSDKNITSAITGKNAKGMYVVSNGQFKSKNEAIESLLVLKLTYPNAWIKKGE